MFDDKLIQKQYEEYKENYVEPDALGRSMMRDRITEDLSFVSQMTVEEYTLYLKYQEIHRKYPTHEIGTLFGSEKQFKDEKHVKLINEVKNNIWMPESPEDFENLEPELIYTSKEGDDNFSAGSWSEIWNCIRTFTSTMKNSSNIGRNLHYVVRDKPTGTYLGVICITGDFIDLTPRDNHIGWERDFKTNSGILNHSCIGSTIVPLQPLGYNYTGGKLLALLCLSEDIQKQWEENYGNKLVSVTTTSLYGKSKTGGLSQYDRLKHWKKCGYSNGSMTYELTKDTEREMLKYGEKNYNDRFFSLYVATRENGQPWKRDHRNRFRSFLFPKLEIPKNIIRSDHQRGIYWSALYDNSREFLRGEIKEDQLVRSQDFSTEGLTTLWKDKYARKRITNLVKNDRTNLDETLFYDDIAFMSWEETKAKYLPQVGR